MGYGDALLNEDSPLGQKSLPSYMDTLLGKGRDDGKSEDTEEWIEEEDEDYSGFKVVEDCDGPCTCPVIKISD